MDAVGDVEGKIKVNLSKNDEKGVLIEFEDNGIGIKEEHLDKIFEPFFTTKEEGTGLGLATCHNIIVMHNGEIEVESKSGKTCFKVVLG